MRKNVFQFLVPYALIATTRSTWYYDVFFSSIVLESARLVIMGGGQFLEEKCSSGFTNPNGGNNKASTNVTRSTVSILFPHTAFI